MPPPEQVASTIPNVPPSTTRKVARNTLYQFGARLSVSLISLVSLGISARYLGVGPYGAIATATAYLYLATILTDWGVSTVAVREISRDPQQTQRVVTNVAYIRLLLAGGVVLIAAALLLFLPYQGLTETAILMLLLTVPLSNAFQSFTIVFQSRLEMKYSALSEILSRSAGLVALLIVVGFDLGFVAVLSTWLLMAVVACALGWHWMSRFVKLRGPLEFRYALRLLRSALPFGLASVFITFYFRIDTILLSLLRGIGEVGIYGVAYRAFELALSLGGFFVASIFPLVSAYLWNHDPRLREFVQKSFDVLMAAALPIAGVSLISADAIVALIAGAPFAEAAAPLRILMLALPFSYANMLFGYLLLANGRQIWLLGLGTMALLVNTLTNVYYIPRYGYLSAAWAMVGTEALLSPVALYLVTRSYRFGLSLYPLSKSIVASAAATGAGLGFHVVFESPIGIVVGVSAFLGVYVGLMTLLQPALVKQARELLPVRFARRIR